LFLCSFVSLLFLSVLIGLFSGCGISAILQNSVEFFNLVFGATEASSEFWQTFLLGDVQDYFGKQLDLESVADFKVYLFSSLAIEENVSFRVFWELSKKCGLAWGSLVDYYRGQPHLLTLSPSPFDFGDLRGESDLSFGCLFFFFFFFFQSCRSK
jgi:hypothetical protein